MNLVKAGYHYNRRTANVTSATDRTQVKELSSDLLTLVQIDR